MKTKLTQLSGTSYRLRLYFNLQTARKFYFACVYSLVTYCLSVFGGALTSYRGGLLIKSHEKIVENLFRHYSPNSCPFKYNGLLKLKDIYKLYASVHMYKVLILQENETVAETLFLEQPSHNYETRHRYAYRTPFPRVNAVRRSFRFEFINIWNEVPVTIQGSSSLKNFKKNITNYYLNMY